MNQLIRSAYGIKTVSSLSFEEAIIRVKDHFKAHGFGVLTEIDMRETLREKTGEVIEQYMILGMCNPNLALRSLKTEHEIGLFLPCNVIVHECEGVVHVTAQDPMLMVEMTKNEALRPLAEEASQRIEDALKAIAIS